MRAVASDTPFLSAVADLMAERICIFSEPFPDFLIGPETLGRTLAGFAADRMRLPHIWCDMAGTTATFSPKLNFADLVAGHSFAIIDDLLTTGSSIRKVVDLITEHGGSASCALVVVRSNPDVLAETCHVPRLAALADVANFSIYDPETCPLCAARVPVVLRPGHGHEWIKSNPDYPVAP
jgi:orotate phosphoribosyltransferase